MTHTHLYKYRRINVPRWGYIYSILQLYSRPLLYKIITLMYNLYLFMNMKILQVLESANKHLNSFSYIFVFLFK